jgi:hypothetical protein
MEQQETHLAECGAEIEHGDCVAGPQMGRAHSSSSLAGLSGGGGEAESEVLWQRPRGGHVAVLG